MATIPVVDFSSLSLSISDDDDLNKSDVRTTADQMINAFTTVGFVYLSNTGFPQQLLEEVDSVSGQFFDLPSTTKSRYPYGEENHGWVAMEQEKVNPSRPGDLKECFDINMTALYDDSRWPTAEIPSFKRVMIDCFEVCSRLTMRVLLAIANGLNMKDINYFVQCHAGATKPGGTGCMRVLKYPQLPSLSDIKPNQVRLGEHTDYGSITLLFQGDVGGLQVKCPDGRWIDAVPISNTVLVNIADLMQRWTADRLLSTPHRVMIPADECERMKVRRSLVYFAHPDPEVTITCVDGSDKYPPVNSAQYLDDKIRASYVYVHHTTS